MYLVYVWLSWKSADYKQCTYEKPSYLKIFNVLYWIKFLTPNLINLLEIRYEELLERIVILFSIQILL